MTISFVIVKQVKRPVVYTPKKYTLKGKIIKNVAQRITQDQDPILMTDELKYKILSLGYKGLETEEFKKLDKLSQNAIKLYLENAEVFKVTMRAYKNYVGFGYFKKVNGDTFANRKSKPFFMASYPNPELGDNLEKFYMEKELNGKIHIKDYLKYVFPEFERIFMKTVFKYFPEEERGGVITFFKKIKEDFSDK